MIPCIDITFISKITVSASASSAPVKAAIEESSATPFAPPFIEFLPVPTRRHSQCLYVSLRTITVVNRDAPLSRVLAKERPPEGGLSHTSTPLTVYSAGCQ